jgi:hypothetical protein
MKLKRFYWVRSPRGTTMHMADKRMEGDATRCGRRLAKGWYWLRPDSPNLRKLRLPRCTQCQSAG